jgi:hypothetical protein
MEPLPPEALPTVPHIVSGIFNLAIPNIIVVAVLVFAFAFAAWARLPEVIEPGSRSESGGQR